MKLSKNTKAELKHQRMKAQGSKLNSIYSSGTSKQLWQAWDAKQRSHFLADHIDMFLTELGKDKNEGIEELSKVEYSKLPLLIRSEIAIHHAMGIYKKGGTLENILSIDEAEFQKQINKRDAFDAFISQPFQKKFGSEYRSEYYPMYSSDRKKFVDSKRQEFESMYPPFKKGGKIPPFKQKLKSKIETLKHAITKASATAQKSIQKKIDKLQKDFDYNPTIKQRVAASKGRFYIEVPAQYNKKIYKALWMARIKPKMHTLNKSTKVVVDNTAKLQKAYGIYADILTSQGKPVPALSKIKGTL